MACLVADVLHLPSGYATQIGMSAGQLAPTWSQDGTHLAYASGGVLYTVAADGTGKKRYLAPTKAFAPAWRPDGSNQLAYLTTHDARNTDLWVAGERWARDVIGHVAWSPDGSQLVFRRDDGLYTTNQPGGEQELWKVANPGDPVWSPDGAQIAFIVGNQLWVVPADHSGDPRTVAYGLVDPSTPTWTRQSDGLVMTTRSGLALTNLDTEKTTLLARGAGVGASFAHQGDLVAYSGPRPSCPGHLAIRIFEDKTAIPTYTGSCVIAGTAAADTIVGTSQGGDVIVADAGNDTIRARNGHRDTVDCGPGRDTVYADRIDKLVACEIVRR